MNIYSIKESNHNFYNEKFKEYCELIFKNHYFSNHWKFAIKLEESLSNITEFQNNITYGNVNILFISILHILKIRKNEKVYISQGLLLFPWVTNALNYLGIKAKVMKHGLKRKKDILNIFLDIDYMSDSCCCSSENAIVISTNLPKKSNILKALIYITNMNEETSFGLTGGGVASTDNTVLSDKLRWMRSSYGRTGKVNIPINGNGRFSEMQAAWCLSVIDSGLLENPTLKKSNTDIEIKLAFTNIDLIKSNFTSSFLKLKNIKVSKSNNLKKLLSNYNILFETYKSINEECIYIRVPVVKSEKDKLVKIILEEIC